MSGQPDKSDDLIAELAKLMATDAKGEAAAVPAPKSDASPDKKPVIRIPGMDMPPLSATPREPTSPLPSYAPVSAPPAAAEIKPRPAIRIPGMDPTPASSAPPAATTPVPPTAPRAAVPSPAPKSFAPTPPGSAPNAGSGAGLATKPPAPVRFEPRIISGAAPSVAAAPPAATDKPVAPATSSTKWYGPPETPPEPSRESASHQPDDEQDAPAHDPIADIIAAEVDAEDTTPDGNDDDAAPAAPDVAPPRAAAPPIPVAAPPPVAAPKTRAPLANPIPPENDSFGFAPVFGLGGRTEPRATPAATAPSSASRNDPMDEIESLIGEAVRVDMSGPNAVPPTRPAKPIVNPVSAQTQPRRATIKHRDDTSPQNAEAAILAAAAATGAEVGHADPTVSEEPAFRRRQFKSGRRRTMSGGVRQYVGLAVSGTLLLAAGFGLYWVLGMGRNEPAVAPVLTADATPVKQLPVVAESTPEPRSPVLDQIDGVTPAEEALAATDPVDAVVASATPLIEATESGLANRKVRTVTVRPDGTIVSSEDSVAGAEALPVARPNVPDVPGGALEPSDLLAGLADPETLAVDALSGTPAASEDPIAAVIAEADPTTPVASTAVQTASVLPAGATATPANVVAPTPLPRPSSRATLNGQPSASVTAEIRPTTPSANTALTSGGQSIDLLAQPNPVAAQPTAVASSSNANAYVQLSSQRSEADARASANNISSRWGNVLGNGQLEIHRADLGAKGVVYRVWLPASSRSEAVSICERLKSSGGDCYIP